VQDSIGAAFDAFSQANAGQPFDAAAFNQFVQTNPAHAGAAQALNNVADAIDALKDSGMSGMDLGLAIDAVLNFVTPANMSADQVTQAAQPQGAPAGS